MNLQMKEFWQSLLDAWNIQRAKDNQYRTDKDTYICWVAEDVHEYGAAVVREALKEDNLSTNGEGFSIKAPAWWGNDVMMLWNRKDLATDRYTDNGRRYVWLCEQVEKHS